MAIFLICGTMNKLEWFCHFMPKEPKMQKTQKSTSSTKYTCSCIKFCKGVLCKISKSTYLRHSKFRMQSQSLELALVESVSSLFAWVALPLIRYLVEGFWIECEQSSSWKLIWTESLFESPCSESLLHCSHSRRLSRCDARLAPAHRHRLSQWDYACQWGPWYRQASEFTGNDDANLNLDEILICQSYT